jgi:hypothetical protein
MADIRRRPSAAGLHLLPAWPQHQRPSVGSSGHCGRVCRSFFLLAYLELGRCSLDPCSFPDCVLIIATNEAELRMPFFADRKPLVVSAPQQVERGISLSCSLPSFWLLLSSGSLFRNIACSTVGWPCLEPRWHRLSARPILW